MYYTFRSIKSVCFLYLEKSGKGGAFLDERNRNISDTFGKYNNTAGEVKNVSSSMWEPISAGKSSAVQPDSAQKNPARNSRTPATEKAPANNSSVKKKKASAKKDKTAGTLISQGMPDKKKKSAARKKPAGKKPPVSRTPKGRDMRKDAREQQKHRDELFRFRETYQNELKNQRNHDEISQRRNRNKRKKLKIKNAVTIGSVLVFALVFIVIYCYSRGALIENVIIDGATVYSAQEIQQAAGITKGKNMLSLREGRVRRELTKKLPYIKDVSLKYDLPDTLMLTVRETYDKYVIATPSGWLTLDSDSKVVADTKTEIKGGLFCAEGFDYQTFEAGDSYKPEGVNAERFEILEEITRLFEKSEIVDTAVINLANTEDVIVTVDGEIAVYLGDCKSLEEKIPYASGIIAQVRDMGKKGYIDMRFDLGYFKPGSMTIQ